MLRHWKNTITTVFIVLFAFSGAPGLAQTTLSTADAAAIAEAERRANEQIDSEVERGVREAMGSIKPTFDGKNLIFNVDGVVYSFDVEAEANNVSRAMTTLETLPETPHAHQEVTVEVTNYSLNLIEDRITWTVNGKVVQDTIGGKSIRVRTGSIGEPTEIRVTILSREFKEIFTKDLTITPGDVAVLWEANTYTPPFYKGKPLPSYMSTIKLIPFPTILAEGRVVPPENLIYTWSRNHKNITDISGYGKRYAFIEASGGTLKELLTLTVRDPETQSQTKRTVSIDVVTPKILLYAGSPLQGIRYEEALGKTFVLGTQETTIKGEPFFASNEEVLDGTSPLKWKQNNKDIPSLYRSVTLQKPDTKGSSRIEASIANPTRILQFTQTGLTITYQGN